MQTQRTTNRTDPLPRVLSTAWHAFWEVTR